MSIEITPNLQEHIDLFKKFTNVISVSVEDVPDRFKEQINNVDSLMFKITNNKKLVIKLIAPLESCMNPVHPLLIKNFESFDVQMNGWFEKMEPHGCVLCLTDNDHVESFYFYDSVKDELKEVHNAVQIVETTEEMDLLIGKLKNFGFVNDVNLYTPVLDSESTLINCEVFDEEDPTIHTIYTVLYPYTIINDVSKHEDIANGLLNFYSTIDEVPRPLI
jgi:hypothetical protein